MDQRIPEEIARRRQRRRLLNYLAAGVLGVLVILLLARLLRPSVDRSTLLLAVVDEGDLAVSIPATGKVMPLYEEVIASPVHSKILEVYHRFGDRLKEKEAILRLDLESFYADVEKDRDELRLRRLELEQFKVDTRSALEDMAMQIDIDEMQLERMAVSLVNERYLDSIGASTPDKVKQIALEYKIQEMQLAQLKQKFENQKKKAEIDIETKELDFKTAQRASSLLNKTLEEAAVRSPREATLTWVNDQVGATVTAGSQLAVVADLEHFKIEGELPDGYTDRVAVGNRVEARLGDVTLTGVVGNIVPAIANGKIKFTVTLDDNRHPRLRAGLRVDLFVINSVKTSVTRVDNYSYYTGPGEYDLWVVEGSRLVKRAVTLGESSSDKVEVLRGLHPGDSLVISDMTRYSSETRLEIRD